MNRITIKLCILYNVQLYIYDAGVWWKTASANMKTFKLGKFALNAFNLGRPLPHARVAYTILHSH